MKVRIPVYPGRLRNLLRSAFCDAGYSLPQSCELVDVDLGKLPDGTQGPASVTFNLTEEGYAEYKAMEKRYRAETEDKIRDLEAELARYAAVVEVAT